MTEAEWLSATSPMSMAFWLERQTSTARKLRLFACACARFAWPEMPNPDCETAVETAERVADKVRAKKSLAAAYNAARDWSMKLSREQPNNPRKYQAIAPADCCELSAYSAAHTTAMDAGWENAAGGYSLDTPTSCGLAELARCVFGNPFRPVAFDPAWRTDTAVALARQMYDSRDFGAMPILADALQDAGCEDEQVLMHCRETGGGLGEPVGGSTMQSGPHARGCWVVDAVLGKA